MQMIRIVSLAVAPVVARVIVGAIHGEVLPPLMFNPTGGDLTIAPDFAERLVHTVLHGIAHD